MAAWKRRLLVTAAVAAAVVTGSSIAQAVQSGSWGPVLSVAWVPAVGVAIWPGAYRRCLPRGGGQSRQSDT
jgi:roadblock/LC7 domain-containing protein